MPDPTLTIGSNTLHLLPERAAWCTATRTLFVADLHLGKSATYRRFGVPVPDGADAEALERLDRLVGARRPERIVILGDFIHERRGPDPATLETFARWRNQTIAPVEIDVVLGNHDPVPVGAPDRDPAEIGSVAHVVDDGSVTKRAAFPPAWRVRVLRPGASWNGVRLVHDPDEPSVNEAGEVVEGGEPRLAGHLHPTVHVGGGAVVPAFHWRAATSIDAGRVMQPTLVLPAFSRFTRGLRVRAGRDDRVFAVTDDAVLELR